ncbi:MAG TPA: redoxin domain-containing protein [Planctomycetota bacterium]|nr:redoxin domain-containing protein [Planctomycetota bacterium]
MRRLLCLSIFAPALLLACSSSMSAKVQGRVVDEANRPVPGARLSMGWFSSLGEEPAGPFLESDANGEFKGTLGLTSHRRGPLLALDPERRRGGLAILGWTPEPVTIVLKPLTRVRGRVSYERLPEAVREWNARRREGWNVPCVTVSVPVGPDTLDLPFPPQYGPYGRPMGLVARRPLAAGNFEFHLPAGEYIFMVSGLHEHLGRSLRIMESDRDIDLGVLEVQPYKGHKLSGVDAPEIQVNADTAPHMGLTLGDLRGKWVLLFFWDHRMRFNTHWLPELIRLYNERRADRAKFEIIAIHNCDDVLTVSDLNMARYWDDEDHQPEPIPFPVFVDDDEKTFKAYGIGRGMFRRAPSWFMVDPQGKIELPFDTGDPVRFLKSKLDTAP